MAAELIDLTGLKFGRWKVLERAPNYISPSGNKAITWKCRCTCGTIRNVTGNSLKGGWSKSCGCLAGELCADRNRRRAKHA